MGQLLFVLLFFPLNVSFMNALLPILLLIVVLGLFILLLLVCTEATSGPSSIAALKAYLHALQAKFKQAASSINAETERAALEKHLNTVKASCDRQVISSNLDLQALFEQVCPQIKLVSDSKEVGTKSSWLQLKDAAFSFAAFYFPKAV